MDLLAILSSDESTAVTRIQRKYAVWCVKIQVNSPSMVYSGRVVTRVPGRPTYHGVAARRVYEYVEKMTDFSL
jgi:hypothetical protein